MIITIARQCGSGGHEIDRELASRLDLELYDRKRLEEEARMIKETDEKRASFHKFCTGKAWEDASQYQLSIDTGKISISDAAELIVNYIRAKEKYIFT